LRALRVLGAVEGGGARTVETTGFFVTTTGVFVRVGGVGGWVESGEEVGATGRGGARDWMPLAGGGGGWDCGSTRVAKMVVRSVAGCGGGRLLLPNIR